MYLLNTVSKYQHRFPSISFYHLLIFFLFRLFSTNHKTKNVRKTKNTCCSVSSYVICAFVVFVFVDYTFYSFFFSFFSFIFIYVHIIQVHPSNIQAYIFLQVFNVYVVIYNIQILYEPKKRRRRRKMYKKTEKDVQLSYTENNKVIYRLARGEVTPEEELEL